ncbi:hypothetical protein SADUNF_Sadunf16G0191900 [Salix dunnii]|uniref:PGG domain-containing protein n=1 Tax=Salix dunnii TaxID=1413687 RepID=A0A835MQP2_9ROSI|nr:hypothetical protein SADUNF_Sadunf16G0191900 [Salix dunnii]
MAADQRNIPENPARNFNEYFRFNLRRDTPSDARNTLLVVTTLIVAVTFQAAVNPPAGVWQDDKYSPANCTVVTSDHNDCTIIRYAGTSILHSRNGAGYDIFIFLNSLAFSAATNTILYLLLDSPYQTEVLISIYSTNFAYGASVAAVQPPKTMNWGLLSAAFMLPYFLRVFSNIIKRYR